MPGVTASPSAGTKPIVAIETSVGTIKAELWPDKSPISVDNFLTYVRSGHFDGTIFHRCIRGFMIQCGDFPPGTAGKPDREPIKNEAANGLKNLRGTLAMARTGEVDSATSQFFINTVDNAFLDHSDRNYGYAVFGKVIEGMDVVDAIERAPVVGAPSAGRPVNPVTIKSVRILSGVAKAKPE
jgi:cyclophilin family peptidyl-prolyl cis-trans isomerase